MIIIHYNHHHHRQSLNNNQPTNQSTNKQINLTLNHSTCVLNTTTRKTNPNIEMQRSL